ncbi:MULTISPECIES: hypothetical protein [Pandoraea]|jgi:hypothetical protein|uniref:Uncharacterized protein n=1 Tax=Pandoraea pnomenusa TaxID=93220 RepID=A0A378YVM2_9BURK|nr:MULTISPECIES: hypothetical protein [Pandoraea]AHB08597.1 hypothetical protein U875_18520 [Pandoraea pnomenusa 3kgm]AHB78590.1 hypothetical protein X636_15590 [Pandoraea pnomenusa]AHN77437.1 hypothetical protein DA70_11030 [Pandoraea pnomenusa]AIU28539.1 hypothetical protein LV28_20020 [Pandoraea pnomenusa]MBN9095964.1 hypothetical protein [Pandoraea pnomenusa]
MASTVRRRWRTGTLLLLSVALGSTVAAYHYATGFELGGGVFQQIGFGRQGTSSAPASRARGAPSSCSGGDCRDDASPPAH